MGAYIRTYGNCISTFFILEQDINANAKVVECGVEWAQRGVKFLRLPPRFGSLNDPEGLKMKRRWQMRQPGENLASLASEIERGGSRRQTIPDSCKEGANKPGTAPPRAAKWNLHRERRPKFTAGEVRVSLFQKEITTPDLITSSQDRTCSGSDNGSAQPEPAGLSTVVATQPSIPTKTMPSGLTSSRNQDVFGLKMHNRHT
ncbi:hypothetical protein EOD39_8247 [Acipenser ruthenus]|uniref:Uncharacterized protein n=1 Tax=Acipenser ruthenus TaxID=7906 RepID=A0A662YWB9_ACIRT|nr:hypothetical protein EOD39_8247 [Acipenser ruthenus]